MKIVKNTTERELTEAQLATIDGFDYYFNGKRDFALINDHVVVILPNDRVQKQIERESYVQNAAEEVLSFHPDFQSYIMDDGYGIVMIGEGHVIVRTENKIDDTEIKEGEMALPRMLALRGEGLQACENLHIIAFILHDEIEQ